MATNNFVLTGDGLGFFLRPGTNFNYWVYPRGGVFQSLGQTRLDPCNLYMVARPSTGDHWDIQSSHPIVVMEYATFTPDARNRYTVNVRNAGSQDRRFFIACTEFTN